MLHEMRLNPVPFECIKSGVQTIETRINDEKRRLLNVGDQIVFLKRPECQEKLVVEVTKLSVFSSFKELFKNIDKIEFGFTKEDTLEDQINCLRKYYSKEDEKQYGVIGIHLKIL